MRLLLKILAVIIGVASGVTGLAGASMALMASGTLLTKRPLSSADWTGVTVLGIGAGVAFLGFLIAHRAWLHLRHPDAGTVRDMIGTAVYLIVLGGVMPLFKESVFLLPLIIGLYIFHRVLVSRITTQAFPSNVSTSQT